MVNKFKKEVLKIGLETVENYAKTKIGQGETINQKKWQTAKKLISSSKDS